MSRASELAKCLDLYDDDQTAVHAAAELRRLERVNAELVADAERYRWLRHALSDRGPQGKSHWLCCISEGNPQELDQAIDAECAALTSATKEQQK